MGGRGTNASRNTGSTQSLTRTQKLVNKITGIIEDWIEDSYMDDDDKESVHSYHDLLEQLDMTAAEAREDIIDTLFDDAGTWRWHEKNNLSEEDKALIFMDGEFEDENGNFLKYGDVMKLVKVELKNRNIIRK